MAIRKRLGLIGIFLSLIILPLVAASLDITKVENATTVISELNNPATFQFIINNNGAAEQYQIYSLVGVAMTPSERFVLQNGQSILYVTADPSERYRVNPGYLRFEYEMKGDYSGITKDTLRVKIVPMNRAVSIFGRPLKQNDSSMIFVVKNVENTYLNNITMHVSSVFFEKDLTFSVGPNEEKNITVDFERTSAVKKLVAGPYVIKAQVITEDKKIPLEGIVQYLEQEGTSVTKTSEGYIVRDNIVTKVNEGNVPVKASVEMSRDILTRLFTITNLEPTLIQRHGLYVTYKWEKDLAPTDELSVKMTTNYTFPFLLIVLIVVITLLAKMYSQRSLLVSKRVSFVKTKGGEFALKVRVHVKAKKHVDKVQVVDTLPGMTKLYEKFGTKPDKMDESSRRLTWNIDKMNAGEERVFSYIIYSKVKVVGRFELPSTLAIFEREGKAEQVVSNRTFFVAETARGIVQ
jgi:hypothetical protein